MGALGPGLLPALTPFPAHHPEVFPVPPTAAQGNVGPRAGPPSPLCGPVACSAMALARVGANFCTTSSSQRECSTVSELLGKALSQMP